MNEINDGGPAFPWPVPAQHQAYTGMTLRDYFAAKAMQSVMNGAVLPTKDDRDKWLPQIGDLVYEVADAMLKARES